MSEIPGVKIVCGTIYELGISEHAQEHPQLIMIIGGS
jgi:hypothetical protein